MPSLAAARSWRINTLSAIQNAPKGSGSSATLEESATTWLQDVDRGKARTRSGDSYKPSVARSYETCMRLHVFPVLGSRGLSAIHRKDIQQLADQIALTKSASTVRNTMNALRAFFRLAVSQGFVEHDPTEHLMLPAVRSNRDRVATPAEAEILLAALNVAHQPIWACALYSGLRLGEIQALTVSNVHLADGYISVERSWDRKRGFITPKSQAGIRKVPILSRLKPYLEDAIAKSANPTDFLFGADATTAFNADRVRRAANAAWDGQGLKRIGFHEARHTFASFLIASPKLNPKQISVYMGHSSISTTYDIYGKLFPGNEAEAGGLIDSYLEDAKAPAATSTPARA